MTPKEKKVAGAAIVGIGAAVALFLLWPRKASGGGLDTTPWKGTVVYFLFNNGPQASGGFGLEAAGWSGQQPPTPVPINPPVQPGSGTTFVTYFFTDIFGNVIGPTFTDTQVAFSWFQANSNLFIVP